MASAPVRNPIPRLVAVSIARPWWTLVAGVVLLVLAGLFAADRFAMTTDTAALISPDVAWRQQERRMEAAFPQLRDAMLVVVDGRTPELAEDGAARLADKLAGDKAHVRNVSRPDGGEFFAREGLLYGSVAEVRSATQSLVKAQPLLGPLASDPSLRGVVTALGSVLDGVERGDASLASIDPAMRALADTGDAALAGRPAFFSWQQLFAGGGMKAPTRRLVLVRPVLNYGDLQPGADAADVVRATAASLGLDAAHGVSVRLTGEVPINDEEFATLQENIGLVAGVMLAAMLLTLWLATRSAKLVAAILMTIVVGLVVTTAIGLAAVGQLNLISIAFIPLFVGLGVDFGIQITVRFNAERADGLAAAEALRSAAEALGAPLALAAGAVFLGFGAFLPTAYVGISQLGIIAGLGMVVALLLSVTLLPALVMLLGPGKPAREVGFRAMAPADRWLATHRRWVLWAFGVAMVASVAALPLVRFDFNPFHLRSQTEPAMATLNDLTRDPDRTPATIDVLAANRAEGAALAKRLAALPEVRQVVSLDSFVPDDQPAKLALTQDASTLLDLTLNPFDISPAPSDADLVAALRTTATRLAAADAKARVCVTPIATPQRCTSAAGKTVAARLARVFARLAAGTPGQRAAMNAAVAQPLNVMLAQTRASLGAQAVSDDTLPAALRRDWVTPNGQVRLSVFPAGNANDNATLERFRAAVARVTPAISGLPVATQSAAKTVAGAFVQAGVIAFVLVSLLLLAVLRDAREVAFTLAPVILSIFLTLGSCVVIGQPINFANIIAFPLLFGVGVAFHIYFVMAWRAGATDLLQSSLARAVLFSALATGTAFGSLWLSHHPGTASMGKILMISLAWTLVCALIFEPALLGPPRPVPAKR